MKDGFIKVAAVSPDIKVCDCIYNVGNIINDAIKLSSKGVKIVVFPELCLTGYTCGDLFLQDVLLDSALVALEAFCKATAECDTLYALGLPIHYHNTLYNVAAIVFRGKVLGMVPKSHIPNYSEFYEKRHFSGATDVVGLFGSDNCGSSAGNTQETIKLYFQDEEVPVGSRLLFECANMEGLVVGAEICEDLWVPSSPSSFHAMAGATVILNLSASEELINKADYRRGLVKQQSASSVLTYIYADAGMGESTTDMVFSGHSIIAEDGNVIGELMPFEGGYVTAVTDIKRLTSERRRMTTFSAVDPGEYGYRIVRFEYKNVGDTLIERDISPTPFVPSNPAEMEARCEEILNIQAYGLIKRLEATGIKKTVIGLSGGLDSTLALLATFRAYKQAGMNISDIHCFTMPCFGTTDRTHDNAGSLAKILGTSFEEIRIEEAIKRHFEDIGQDPQNYDVTYENSQARERTQILMDKANQLNALVVGTGDLSEVALGWCTYNGDHMSMYGVNASIPKTLIRYIVKYIADTNEELKEVLYDILDTPVSPELLPAKDGEIAQKTEDIIGPYEVHDFILYYMTRYGYMPTKIFRMATKAFTHKYDKKKLYNLFETYYKRFFTQQFKRSAMPDGPKVGSVALSPRGDLRMPSDASNKLWMMDLERLAQGEC